MALIEGLREALGSKTVETEADEQIYQCIDCYAEFDERQQLCPKCGGEKFERV